MGLRPDATITKTTRVMLYDVADVFVCTWIGYVLPDHIGNILNNERIWPNKNAATPYLLRWVYDGDPKIAYVQSFGFPLGMGIQTELTLLARL